MTEKGLLRTNGQTEQTQKNVFLKRDKVGLEGCITTLNINIYSKDTQSLTDISSPKWVPSKSRRSHKWQPRCDCGDLLSFCMKGALRELSTRGNNSKEQHGRRINIAYVGG